MIKVVKETLNSILDIDIDIMKIIRKCFCLGYIFLIIATYILYLYTTYPVSVILYKSGLLIMQAGFTIFVSSLISGFVIDKIKF